MTRRRAVSLRRRCHAGPQVIERTLEDAIATSGTPRAVSPALAGLATEAQIRILTDWLEQRLGASTAAS